MAEVETTCKHCGHAACYHRYSKAEVENYRSLGLQWVTAGCRGLFIHAKRKRQPYNSGYGCVCPMFEAVS